MKSELIIPVLQKDACLDQNTMLFKSYEQFHLLTTSINGATDRFSEHLWGSCNNV